jgi:hypothetical protein
MAVISSNWGGRKTFAAALLLATGGGLALLALAPLPASAQEAGAANIISRLAV